ncbi:PREDICTED: sec-independent protein translocase protein TATB, chloroplastic-like [Camelina sativa]|uniref:Sec-independent protein translocase protein TATB, chloroplastic-like n=1 Tax=Camelina sativa TaxID=90675 RepID=A0ABM0UR83_CAMSA|nr:PREDICTED: sec-independent protein translocase protein TATB, chloroplastic-like [Camelina sativa]
MAMAFQIIASSSSSLSPTITKSHLFSYHPLQSCYKASSKPNHLSSWCSLLGSSRFSPYIGLKHLGISVSTTKSSNPEMKRRCKKSMVIRASLFGVGAPEALVIGVVALLVFGPKGLAEVARNLGKTLRTFQPTIRELQDVSRDFKSTLEREIGLDDISSPNVYNQNRMNTVQPPPPPPPPPSAPQIEDPVTASDPNDVQSPKAYTTEDYLKITEEQLKAKSTAESQTEDQTQTQESLQQPAIVQTPTGESQPNGTARETTAASPPRQD